MSQSSTDAPAAAYRRKVRIKTIIFAFMILFFWLQPKIQTWRDGRKASESGSSDTVAHDHSPRTGITQVPANRSRVVIEEVDEPILAEGGRDDSTSSTLEKSPTKSPPVPGELREIRNLVFESTAGLQYVPGSADTHRLKHIMQHAKDDLSKPKHGVFEGDRDKILAVIDEAYEKAKIGGKDVRKSLQNERTVFTVNLDRKIGYVGGSSGKRDGNPDCRFLQLVLEDENVVITAYPTRSF